MLNLGTVRPGSTLYVPFDSFDGGTGASITMTGLAVTDIEVYKDGGTTQRASDSGYTLLDTDGIDFDALTGIHGFSISLADNTTAGFWAAGGRYFVVVSSITIDAQTVSFVAACFDIGYPDALINTTIATLSSQTSFTLTAGPAEDDALNGFWAVIHDVASAVQLSRVLISDYTGSTKTVTLAAGAGFTAATTDNVAIMGPAPLQPATTGRTLAIESDGMAHADVKEILGDAQSATDLKDFADAGYDPATNKVEGVKLADTLTTYTGNTVQTGDSFARIGATGSGLTSLASQASVTTIDDLLDAEVGAIKTVVDAIEVDTQDLQSKIGTPAGASVSADIAAIEAQTDDIGTAGAGLTALPWNAAWDAQVESEVADALAVYDPPTKAELDSAHAATDALITAVDNFVDTEVAAIKTVVDAIEVDTQDIQSRIGTVTDLGAGATLAANLQNIESQTLEIGAAGAGLYAVPWNAAWDAEVQSECADALVDIHLDHLLAADYDPASKPGVATALLNELVESDAGVSRYTVNALEQGPSGSGSSPEAIADEVQTRTIAAVTSVGSVTGAVGSVTADVGITQAGADKVWGTGTRALTDKAGFALSAGGIQAIWDALTSALTAVGSAGKLLVDNLNATISSRATPAQVNTEADAALVDVGLTTTITGRIDAAITSRLSSAGYTAPLDAAGVRTAVGLASANLDTQIGDLPTNAELATSQAAADDATLSAVAALSVPTAAAVATAVLSAADLNPIAANIKEVNDVVIVGDGAATPWGS